MERKKVRYADTLKSADTEETLDLLFYRLWGYAWALLFRWLHIPPNPVTVAGIFIGVVAGILFGFSDLYYNVIGMALLAIANSLDSADGQLARMTGQKTRIGHILDGMCGNIWFITIYIALCVRMQHEGFAGWIWALGALAGVSHILQAQMADYYRNIHLLFIKGKEGSEVERAVNIRQMFKELRWTKHFIRKIMMAFYLNYTYQQEKFSPKLQQFLGCIRDRFGDETPQWLRDEFRAQNKPLMKYTNMLTFNTRIIVLFISLFLHRPWIYFVFELTALNIMLLYMMLKQESISLYFYTKVNNSTENQKDGQCYTSQGKFSQKPENQ